VYAFIHCKVQNEFLYIIMWKFRLSLPPVDQIEKLKESRCPGKWNWRYTAHDPVLTRWATKRSKIRWCVQIATLIVCLLHYCSQMLSLFLLARKTMSILRHTIRFL